MSFFISTTRMMKFALQNFFRNFWLSFITMTIFLLTLITVNTVLIMNVVADTALESVEQKVEVSVYFTPEASEDLVKSVQGYLLGLSQVRDVMFTQADDALAAFKEQNADNPVILESLEELDCDQTKLDAPDSKPNDATKITDFINLDLLFAFKLRFNILITPLLIFNIKKHSRKYNLYYQSMSTLPVLV